MEFAKEIIFPWDLKFWIKFINLGSYLRELAIKASSYTLSLIFFNLNKENSSVNLNEFS